MDDNLLQHLYTGLGVTIDCKAANGKFKTRGVGKLDEEGKFKVSLTDLEILEDGKLKEECFAQLHSASAAPCPSHSGLESSKIIFKSKTNGKHMFTPVGKLKFSPITCTSAFLLPHPPLYKPHPWKKSSPKFQLPPLRYFGHHHYHHHHYYLPPPMYKKPQPPPVPIYKPKPKPPVYKPPPVPVYKPKPKPPPVPVYKPKPPVYKPPPVPVYKPKPKPPPTPVYKPKPPVYMPPPTPIYKPKPPVYMHPPIPIYKPIPPFPKKPCPPIPKIPPKHFHHHPIFGGWPPLPPHFPHH